MPANATFLDANAFSDRVLRWELLAAKLAPLLDDRPYLKPLYEDFAARIEEIKGMEFQIKGLQASTQKLVSDRRERMKEGEEIRTRLASALAFEHGPKSLRLHEFGVKPRRGGRPRKKAAAAAQEGSGATEG
jgi:hypothetical protein